MVRLGLLAALILAVAGCAEERQAAAPPTEAISKAAAVDWTRAERIEVVLDDYDYAPARLAFREGRPYRLYLRNGGDRRHDFTAPSFFRNAALHAQSAADEIAGAGGRIVLAKGESREIELVPLQSGTYALECSQPLHDLFGMTGEIVVAGESGR